ncbi:MAG TPA: hypothetical protein VL172_17315 [Kofleriaceae bacterium]|nr:hypothetical protein [Kofleriaceae bacterium]
MARTTGELAAAATAGWPLARGLRGLAFGLRAALVARFHIDARTVDCDVLWIERRARTGDVLERFRTWPAHAPQPVAAVAHDCFFLGEGRSFVAAYAADRTRLWTLDLWRTVGDLRPPEHRYDAMAPGQHAGLLLPLPAGRLLVRTTDGATICLAPTGNPYR